MTLAERWDAFKGRLEPAEETRVDWFLAAPFFLIHASLLLIPWLGFGGLELLTAIATYGVGMFFVTAGHHRYFSHRAFRTSRAGQLVLGVGAVCAIQKGVMWWASHHREHHRTSDTEADLHSLRRGFFWSHVGWFLCNRYEKTLVHRVRDLHRFPELRWLDRWYWVPPVALSLVLLAIGGLRLVVGGYFLGIIALYHGTFTINSLAHRWGRKRYPTGDDSRNNALLALLTFGEGWHNNHHFAPSAARQGFRWWEIDVTYYVLRLLEKVGIIWELNPVPARVGRPVARVATSPWGEQASRAGGYVRAAAIVAAVGVILVAAAAFADVERFTGEAYSTSGKLLYRETHDVTSEGGKLVRARTRYLDAQGREFAVLDTDHSRDPFAPDYTFRDRRSGIFESSRRDGGMLILRRDGRTESVRLPADGVTISAGQGLNHFARMHLDELAGGRELKVRFAIPSRFDTYVFRVRGVARSADRIRVRIEIDDWILRLLAPSLEVDYETATGRLMAYRGVSNLTDADGDSPQVRIRYSYPGGAR